MQVVQEVGNVEMQAFTVVYMSRKGGKEKMKGTTDLSTL